MSAFFTVDNLCAMIIVVTFLCEILSNAEVASSKINILGLANTALAIAILCFCPPDNLLPLIPTI